jgi:hypothetical protein
MISKVFAPIGGQLPHNGRRMGGIVAVTLMMQRYSHAATCFVTMIVGVSMAWMVAFVFIAFGHQVRVQLMRCSGFHA